MALRLVVKSATDLPKLDRFSKVDPYCELTFHEEKQSTTTISNNQNPEWNESFKWTLEVTPEVTEVIEVLIADSETLGKNRPMCKGSIPLATVLEKGSASLDVSVVSPEGEPLDTKVHVDLTYRAPVSETLKGEVGALTVRVEELEELLENLKGTVAEKEGEVTEMKGQIDPLKATLVEKETEVTTAKGETEQVKATAAGKEAELSEAKEQIDKLKAENEGLTTTATEKEAELSKLKEENEQLKQENARLSAKPKTEQVQQEPTTAADTGGEDLKAQNESLTREVAALKQQVEELEEERRNRPTGGDQPASGGERQARNGCCGLL